MKKILSTLLIYILFLGIVSAQSKLLDKANKLYKEARYEQAIEEYTKITDKNIISAEIYFNIGNCYYKQKQIAPAILNYERAKKLNPEDEDILYNLNLSKHLTTDKIKMVPTFVMNTWFVNLRSSISEKQWSILSISFFILSLILISIFLYSKIYSLKKTSFFLGIMSFIFSITLLLMAYSSSKHLQARDYAIVFSPSVTLRSSPDKSGNKLFVLHEGTKVKIIDEIGDWAEVRILDGNQAWLETKDIEKI